MFNAKATKNIGVDNLYAMMHAAENAPRFGAGGRVRYPGLFPGNDIEPRWLPGADLPNDAFGSVGGGPIVDLGFGERPIFRWPYEGPTQGWYIVRSGITIYPGDDDELPEAPPLTPVDPYGLPIGPGGLNEGPGLFPGDQPEMVRVNGWPDQRAPYWGNVPIGANPWWSTFNPSLGSSYFPSLAAFNYGQHPIGATSVSLGTHTPEYNTARGRWEWFDANDQLLSVPGPPPSTLTGFGGVSPVSSTSFIPGPVRVDPGFIDPATGLSIAASGTVIGRDTVTGAPIVRGAGGQVYVLSGNNSLGSLSQTDRFAQGSGTGNWIADQFTKNYLLGGGDPGVPNMPQSDVPSTFYGGVWQLDPESGAYTQVGNRINALRPTHELLNTPASIAAYNAWLMSLGHHADGTRIPGPASRADNILAWLSTGERVVPAERNIALERAFGFDWDKRLEVAMPRFADGGVAGGRRSEVGGQNSEQPIVVNVHYYNDERKAMRAFQDDPTSRKVFRRNLQRYS
jgi:hypothetical protein